jgi:signal transduction histidine kinase
MSVATSDALCNNLMEGMHSAAQPLAILRARFYPDYIETMDKGQLRELALSASSQVERLCTLFNYLQQLLAAASTEPKLAPADIATLVENTVEGVELFFLDSKMAIRSTVPAESGLVMADKSRTQQALSAVVLIAHHLSAAGQTVEVSVMPTPDAVEVNVLNSASTIDVMTGESKLGMAVAETHIRSQGGDFAFSLHPLQISIRLPRPQLQN